MENKVKIYFEIFLPPFRHWLLNKSKIKTCNCNCKQPTITKTFSFFPVFNISLLYYIWVFLPITVLINSLLVKFEKRKIKKLSEEECCIIWDKWWQITSRLWNLLPVKILWRQLRLMFSMPICCKFSSLTFSIFCLWTYFCDKIFLKQPLCSTK